MTRAGLAGALVAIAAATLSAQHGVALNRIVGTAWDSVAHRAMAGVSVSVQRDGGEGWRARRVVADARGRFAFDSLPPGRYVLEVTHSWLDSAAIAGIPVAAEVRAGAETRVSLGTPSARTLRALLCPGDPEDTVRNGIAVGTVYNVDDSTRRVSAEVLAFWNELVADSATHQVRRQRRGEVSEVGDEGAYRMCGLPVAQKLAMQAQTDSLHYSGVVNAEVPATGVLVLPFYVDAMHRAGDSVGVGVVVGQVRAADGGTVPRARVSVTGTPRSVITDDSGRFRLSNVSRGTQPIRVTALGFDPVQKVVVVRNDTHPVSVTLSRSAVVLDSVVTRARRAGVDAQLALSVPGFLRRRDEGFGTFFSADSIERLHPRVVADLFPPFPALPYCVRG